MIIRRIKNLKELDECIEITKADYDKYSIEEFPFDEKLCKSNFKQALLSDKYIRVIEKNNEIVSWIVATKGLIFQHSSQEALLIEYYKSKLTGYSAAKSLIYAHEDAINYARLKKIKYVVSSSIMNNSDVYENILIKQGWIKRKSILIYKT